MLYFVFGVMASLVMASTCCFADETEVTTRVILKTNKGSIEVELFDDKAPLSTENFIQYAENGHYNGTIFHRVIDGFMIQGGGFTEDMSQKKTGLPIKNEANNGLKNKRGTLAMARTMELDSATSQFFINVADNDFLDHQSSRPEEYGYAVFGRVVKGMDVVDKIKETKTASTFPHQDVPVEQIVIEQVKVLSD